jgi:hypothetical protein
MRLQRQVGGAQFYTLEMCSQLGTSRQSAALPHVHTHTMPAGDMSQGALLCHKEIAQTLDIF